jgi:hypothetical protein
MNEDKEKSALAWDLRCDKAFPLLQAVVPCALALCQGVCHMSVELRKLLCHAPRRTLKRLKPSLTSSALSPNPSCSSQTLDTPGAHHQTGALLKRMHRPSCCKPI